MERACRENAMVGWTYPASMPVQQKKPGHETGPGFSLTSRRKAYLRTELSKARSARAAAPSARSAADSARTAESSAERAACSARSTEAWSCDLSSSLIAVEQAARPVALRVAIPTIANVRANLDMLSPLKSIVRRFIILLLPSSREGLVHKVWFNREYCKVGPYNVPKLQPITSTPP